MRFVLLTGCFGKEGVIELNDTSLRTVVELQRADFYHLVARSEFPVYGVEQSPVAGAPAVDALLDVADYEIFGVCVAHALLEQYLEILPLNRRGVLKLVYHDVFQLGSYLLEDERGVAVLDERVQQLLGVAEQEAVGLVVHLAYLFLYTVKKTQLVQVA